MEKLTECFFRNTTASIKICCVVICLSNETMLIINCLRLEMVLGLLRLLI